MPTKKAAAAKKAAPLLDVPPPPEVEPTIRPVAEGEPGHAYRYKGDGERYFPTLGVTLQPGQTVTLSAEVHSPVLVKE